MKRDADPVEVEVLPPETRRETSTNELAHLIAFALDNLFRLPGTNFRVGLDPLIGLIPGVGPALSSFIAALIVVKAVQSRVPKIIIARMCANILANAVLDSVPVLGDLLSVWFKSNAMNYALLEKHGGASRPASARDWLVVGGMLLVLLLAIAGVIVTIVFLIASIWHAVAAPR